MKLRAGEWAVLGGSVLIALFAAVVGTVIYLKPPPARYRYIETPLAQAGEAIYRREGCNACHRVFGNGATYGPSLDGIGSRRDAAWLAGYLRQPRPGVSATSYRVQMPSYAGLGEAKLRALVAYLQALREIDADGRIIQPGAGERAGAYYHSDWYFFDLSYRPVPMQAQGTMASAMAPPMPKMKRAILPARESSSIPVPHEVSGVEESVNRSN